MSYRSPATDEPRLSRKASRCAFGVAIAVLAIAGQVALRGAGIEAPFALVYPAVLLATWAGGVYSGGCAVVAAALGLVYYVLPPAPSLSIAAARDAFDLGLFCVIASVQVYLVERARRLVRLAKRAQAAADSASAAREAMVAVVAHDLRNPLQTIALNAELLTSNVVLDDRKREALGRLRRSAQRAYRLVETILERADHERELFPLAEAETPLSTIVEDSVAPFEPMAESRGVALERPRADELVGTVVCDRERIVQVLTNLLGNAFQFTPRGGTVRLAIERAAEVVRFTVSDTAGGMTKDELAHAFERLWHGSRPGHGRGLGLWIARTLVEAHGGFITVESAIGRGTTMSFVLPREPPARSAESGEAMISTRRAHVTGASAIGAR